MAMMYLSEVNKLIYSSLRDINRLYGKFDKLSYEEQGVFLIDVVQFLAAVNVDYGKNRYGS